jgi:hypothetical protein
VFGGIEVTDERLNKAFDLIFFYTRELRYTTEMKFRKGFSQLAPLKSVNARCKIELVPICTRNIVMSKDQFKVAIFIIYKPIFSMTNVD